MNKTLIRRRRKLLINKFSENGTESERGSLCLMGNNNYARPL